VLTFASRLFFLTAIGLLVWAGVLIAISGNAPSVREALVVEEPQRDVGELPAGAHTVTFRVRNTTQQPQRIVGMSES
jgi:hypothetical protein